MGQNVRYVPSITSTRNLISIRLSRIMLYGRHRDMQRPKARLLMCVIMIGIASVPTYLSASDTKLGKLGWDGNGGLYYCCCCCNAHIC